MKRFIHIVIIFFAPFAGFAQGSLTPPGPPSPVFKTLGQVEPRIPVSVIPTNLTQAGSYYLTTNLTGAAGTNGITVTAANVTIDLNGFTLTGVPGSLSGISSSANALRVLNGRLASWGRFGVEGTGLGANLSDLHISGCSSNGIATGNLALVQDCVSQSNGGHGVAVGNDSVVVRCRAAANTQRGFTGIARFSACTASQNSLGGFLGSGTFDGCRAFQNAGNGGIVCNAASAVSHCVAIGNNSGGILISSGVVSDCTASGNTGTGLYATSGAAEFRGCVAEANTIHGILVMSDASLIQCQANANNIDGIVTSAGSRVEECHAANNVQVGMVLGDHNVAINCSARGNGLDGITATQGSLLRNNHCAGNGTNAVGGAGILVTSDRNRIEGNNCVSNSFGLRITGQSNLILANSTAVNATNYVIGVNNRYGAVVNVTSIGAAAAIGSGPAASTIGTTDPWANFAY